MSDNSVAVPMRAEVLPTSVGKKPLTHRQRKRLKKLQQIQEQFKRPDTETARREAQIERFIADGVKKYKANFEHVEIVTSEILQTILDKVWARIRRKAERGDPNCLDLRRMDVRYWELRLVCRWNPNLRDKDYWPERRTSWLGYRYWRELYEWWIHLDPIARERVKEDSELMLRDTPREIKTPLERQKRAFAKSSTSSEQTESPFAELVRP